VVLLLPPYKLGSVIPALRLFKRGFGGNVQDVDNIRHPGAGKLLQADKAIALEYQHQRCGFKASRAANAERMRQALASLL
jgi:hypothetical protein